MEIEELFPRSVSAGLEAMAGYCEAWIPSVETIEGRSIDGKALGFVVACVSTPDDMTDEISKAIRSAVDSVLRSAGILPMVKQ